MRLRTRVAVAAVAAMLLTTAAVAWANGINVTLIPGTSQGYYGQDIALVPQASVAPFALGPKVNGKDLPADKFEFQIKNNGVWEKYDDQLVEENGSVDPLYLVFDDSVKYPATFRVLYWGTRVSADVPQATSEPVTIYRQKYAASKVAVKAPKKVKRNKTFTTSYVVKPLSGAGTVKVKVERKIGSRYKTVLSKKVKTDEMSEGTLKLKLKNVGTHRITATFAGNVWASKSGTVTKKVVVTK